MVITHYPGNGSDRVFACTKAQIGKSVFETGAKSTWQQVMENTFARYREEGGIVDDGWCRFELEAAVNRKMMTMGEITSDKIPELIAFMVAFLNQRVRRVVVRTAGDVGPHHTDGMVGIMGTSFLL